MGLVQSDRQFLEQLCCDIPLLSHMGLTDLEYGFPHLSIHAKFLPNINDKGTGFGGSINTLMTIAGWSLVTRRLTELGLVCDVVIHKSSIEFLTPVHGNFYSKATWSSVVPCAGFVYKLEQRGRAGVDIELSLFEIGAEQPSAVMFARYVAIHRYAEESVDV